MKKVNSLFVFAFCVLCNISFAQKKTTSFCANVGSVEITIDGSKFTGTYLITVSPEPIPGKLEGTIKNGLMTGKWIDKDGVGDMLMGFDPDMQKFYSIYNTAKDKTNWYNYWRGVSTTVHATLTDTEKAKLFCPQAK